MSTLLYQLFTAASLLLISWVMFYVFTFLIMSEASTQSPSKTKEVTKQTFCYKFYWYLDCRPYFIREWPLPNIGIIPTYALRDCWRLWETSHSTARAPVMIYLGIFQIQFRGLGLQLHQPAEHRLAKSWCRTYLPRIAVWHTPVAADYTHQKEAERTKFVDWSESSISQFL